MAGKKKRKHLVEIRSRYAEDGTVVHHHTYRGEDGKDEPERQNVATSRTPEEAGQHTEDQFSMNAPQEPDGDKGGAAPDASAEAAAPAAQ